MAKVRGCNLPDNLLYDVPNHIWYQELDDGSVKVGMTAVATAMAGRLVAYTPKAVGKEVKAGKSCATVESGKWVGPAKLACAGTVATVNEAMVATPAIANEDPYEKGWLLVIKPLDWGTVRPTLVAGVDVAGPYEAKRTADGFAGCGG